MAFDQSNVVAQLIWQSDYMTKGVLLVLLIMSVLCWAIFFYKLIVFKIKQRQVRAVLKYIKKVQTADDLRTMAAAFSQTLPGYVVAKNLSFLKGIIELKSSALTLDEHDLQMLSQRVNQTVDDVLLNEESYIPFLTSCAAVAPLLGLFGTVWGLVHAFMSISQAQQADIITIAPGLAEALVTTLAGLLVAIPALLMSHYLSGKLRYLEQQLYLLADKLSWIVQSVFAR